MRRLIVALQVPRGPQGRPSSARCLRGWLTFSVEAFPQPPPEKQPRASRSHPADSVGKNQRMAGAGQQRTRARAVAPGQGSLMMAFASGNLLMSSGYFFSLKTKTPYGRHRPRMMSLLPAWLPLGTRTMHAPSPGASATLLAVLLPSCDVRFVVEIVLHRSFLKENCLGP